MGRRMLTFTVAKGAEAECLTIAFYRFIELHGRTTVVPGDHCSLTTVPGRKLETKLVELWNHRADADFGGFLERYREVYGERSGSRRATQGRA